MKNLMTIQELKKRLQQCGVSENLYSLEGNLLPDRIVLYKNYSKWEVFYFDERGNSENLKVFASESDACDYIFQQLTGQSFTTKQDKITLFNAQRNKIIQLINCRLNNEGEKERETLNNLLLVLYSYTFEDRLTRKGLLSSLITKGVFGGLCFNGLKENDVIVKEIFQFDNNIE